MKSKSLFVSVLLLLVWQGCRSHYDVVADKTLSVIENPSPELLFEQALSRYDTDTSMLLKASANVSLAEETVRSRVQVRWIKDRFIQISILPLMGVELCRFVFTPDTVYFIDRYHKQYAIEPAALFQRSVAFDISFSTVQSLLLARPFLPGGETKPGDVSRFSVEPDTLAGVCRYTFVPQRPAVDYGFDIDNRACLVSARMGAPSTPTSLICHYAAYHIDNNRVVPEQMSFLLSGLFSVPVSLVFDKMEYEWNRPQNISTAVSLQYQRTDLQTWIDTIFRR